MFRRYDRRQRELAAGLEILKASTKPKPWWMPTFMWMRILRLVFR